MYRLGFAFSCLLVAVGPLVAASPDPKTLIVPHSELSRARDLVKKLGGDEYDDREAAQKDLATMGRLALPVLLEAMNDNPSPEVRFRCQELLPRANALDLQARIDTFLADTKGKYEHDLPGWTAFRKQTGNTATARAVFTELLRDPDNRRLLVACGGPAGELGGLVSARKMELYQWRTGRIAAGPGGRLIVANGLPRREPTVPDVITLLFAESQVPSKYVPAAPRNISASTLLSVSGVTAAIITGGDKADVYKAITGHWIDTRDDALSMYYATTIGNNLGMTDRVLRVSVKLAAMPSATGTYRGNAIMMIVRQEAKQHIAVLEKLLSEQTVVTTRIRVVGGQQMRDEIQVRDVALVACLLLTDQEPEDYGFTSAIRGAGAVRTSYSNWTIPTEKRADALKKWKAWRAAHPDKEKGK